MKKDIIMQFINNQDWEGMKRMLSSLSNMEFRRIEQTVRQNVLPYLENDLYWEALLHLIIFKRQAFISGIFACEHLIRTDTLNVNNESVSALYKHLKENNPDSLIKMTNMMLPLLQSEQQVNDVFNAFHIDNDITRLSVLLKVESPLSYYIIFKTLKIVDDKIVANKCSKVIMKRNNDMAFNAVSLIKSYFALDELPARFSLTIPEYELNHIDRNYNTFLNILNGKRPKL